MPTADQFTALGAGNGFPFCPVTKLDISNAGATPHWTTLSGYNDQSVGPPTDAQIQESHRLAMKLFWNLNGFTAYIDCESGFSGGTSPAFTAAPRIDGDADDSGVNDMLTTPLTTESGNKEPKERVCVRFRDDTKNEHQVDINEYGESLHSELNYYLAPTRMYNGDTSDESNFIGWGNGVGGRTTVYEGNPLYATSFEITFGDYGAYDDTFEGVYGILYVALCSAAGAHQEASGEEKVEKVVFNGMHFLMSASTFYGVVGGVQIDAENLEATFDTGYRNDPSVTSLSFTNTDFYTYT